MTPKRITEWREKNRDRYNESQRANYRVHREKRLLSMKQWKDENKELNSSIQKNYRIKNSALINAKNMKRQCSKLRRTPKWLSKSEIEQIKNIYKIAKMKTLETGIRHEVDHILPLNGKTVSGLHVLCNLQIITKRQNILKGNGVYFA